jgi:hypothetical protein
MYFVWTDSKRVTPAHQHATVLYRISLATHVVTHSLIIAVPVIQSLNHDHTFTYSLNRSWIQRIIYSATHPFKHWPAHSFMHSITHTFSHAHTQRLTRTLIHALNHHAFNHTPTQPLIRTLINALNHCTLDHSLFRPFAFSATGTFTHSLTLTPIF